MAEVSKISWTNSTFNPWIGCTKVSPGCDNCYAQAMMDARYGRVKWGPGEPRVRTSEANWKEPLRWERKAAKAGQPWRVFCASLADVFDNEVDDAWRWDLFDLIKNTPHLTWLLLTKRIGNVEEMTDPLNGGKTLPDNVAIGASFVNQNEYDRDRIKLHSLKDTVGPLFTFGSFEPLLDAIIPDKFAPDWLIVGGESGGKARPCWVPDVRRIVWWSAKAKRAVFVKQLGSNCQDRDDAGYEGDGDDDWPEGTADKVEFNPNGYIEEYQGSPVRIRLTDRAGSNPNEWPEDLRIHQFPRLP